MSKLKTKLCLYGYGLIGKYLLRELEKEGYKVEFIIDRKLAGTEVNGIKILSIEDLKKISLAKVSCIISLHNHYVDIVKLNSELSNLGFKDIFTITGLRSFLPDFNLPNGYWLNFDENLDDVKNELNTAKDHLHDAKSKEIFEKIIKYRESGSIDNYPFPSLSDEYTPNDLPKFLNPLRIIDCGAFTGVALEKFQKAGYEIDSILAFEPDPENYKKLLNNKTTAKLKIFLPLATHSEDVILKFSSDNGMGSKLDEDGGVSVQATKIDSVQIGFNPNLIKFDVEGAEIETLIGAENTIKKIRPNLCISAYHKPYHIFQIQELVQSWNLDYKFYLRVHEHNSFGVVLYCLQDSLIDK